jgi:hypothetical protein
MCRNCAEKQPFQCSRCEAPLGQSDVYQVERIKFKSALFCHQHGQENEVVKCGICKRDLVRATGKEVGGAKVYHLDCYRKQLSTIGTLRKLTPVFGVIGLLSGWFLASRTHNLAFQAVGAVAIGLLFLGLARIGQVILDPK